MGLLSDNCHAVSLKFMRVATVGRSCKEFEVNRLGAQFPTIGIWNARQGQHRIFLLKKSYREV